ncbi:CHD9 neighbor protein [Tenrec ecaudatus]|uniref:CHD9 neighbor protein n=1 Tax=Tenrec ecaudatus TaxID=94439 RepID=UPI003F5A0908
MGCRSSKSTQVVGESKKPSEDPVGKGPDQETGTEAADGKDTPRKEDAPEPKS